MKKIEHTPMLIRYYVKFAIRISIFVGVLLLYVMHKDWLVEFATRPVYKGITSLHVLWLYFMLIMVAHLFPFDVLSMALRKSKKQTYVEVPDYSELELHRFVKDQNIKAWTVMLVWLCCNAVFGFLYLMHGIGEAELIMLSVFFFLCDYICIILFCPFQTWIMKNRCCVNCRIYDWGHFMMFTPMLFIRNFFSWSLFFTSVVVLIHWEIVYAKHPERFWYGSNKTLQCSNCKDKTCQVKKCLSPNEK